LISKALPLTSTFKVVVPASETAENESCPSDVTRRPRVTVSVLSSSRKSETVVSPGTLSDPSASPMLPPLHPAAITDATAASPISIARFTNTSDPPGLGHCSLHEPDRC
jgi:hypothetical protein